MRQKLIYYSLLVLLLGSCAKSYQNKFYKENGFVTNLNESSAPIISQYEVTNKQFRTFLKEDDNKRFNYDSTKWKKLVGIDFKFYNIHPAYDNFPVVNISYEAAEAYCKWLSKEYTLKSKNSDFIVRLPKPSEFDNLIQENIGELRGDYASDYDSCRYVDNLKYLNRKDTFENYDIDGCLIPCPVNKFKQQSHYSILGNVSELCQGGIIKGGNWFTLPSEIKLNKLYELPDPRVGFRIVLEKPSSAK